MRFQFVPRFLNGGRPLSPDGLTETLYVSVDGDGLDHSGIGIASYFLLILTSGSPLLVRSNSPFLDG